jgi:D-alanyl-D-alanine carboxypeptidase (penicillin-binding protein 5/6)
LFVTAVYADAISSRAAIVLDGDSGRILYAKNPNLRLPPASTVKLVTAMVVLDRLDTETVVTVSKRAANTLYNSHIKAGDRFTVRDLLYLALMRSSNSATVALAEAVAGSEAAFVNLMNRKAGSIGAGSTRFINSSGLPGSGQYITVYDLAIIMREALRYPVIREIINTKEKDIVSFQGRMISIRNTNQLLWSHDYMVGGKTGFTRAAQHCFVCAINKNGRMLISVVLGEPVRDNLWTNTTMLLSRGYNILTRWLDPLIYVSDDARGKEEERLNAVRDHRQRTSGTTNTTRRPPAKNLPSIEKESLRRM